MSQLPIELWQLILDYSRHWEQVYLSRLCTYFNKQLKLKDLSNEIKRLRQIKKYYVGKFGHKTIAFEPDSNSIYFATFAKYNQDNVSKIFLNHFTNGGVGSHNFTISNKAMETFKQIFLARDYTIVILNNLDKSETVFYPSKN